MTNLTIFLYNVVIRLKQLQKFHNNNSRRSVLINKSISENITPEELDTVFDGSVNLTTINKLLESIGVNFQLQGNSLNDVPQEDLWKVITFLLYRQVAADTLTNGGQHEMQSM